MTDTSPAAIKAWALDYAERCDACAHGHPLHADAPMYRAVAALADLAAGGGWRAMDIAPRDGTPLLVALPKRRDEKIVGWEYFAIHWHERDGLRGNDDDPDGWYDSEGNRVEDMRGAMWRPLPAPPKEG